MMHEPFRRSPGVFYSIAWWIESIQFEIIDAIPVVEKHWALRWTKSILETLRDNLGEVIVNLWNADTWASDTWTAIGEKLRPDGILNALNDFAHEVYLVWLDPVGWLKYTAWRISDQFGWFVYDPVRWLTDRFGEQYPELAAFVSDPKGYILVKLWELHPELYYFAWDPVGWLTAYVGDVLDEVRWFMRDPYHFVHWYLLKFDSPLAPFWADPGEWMIDHVLDWIVEAILRDWRTA